MESYQLNTCEEATTILAHTTRTAFWVTCFCTIDTSVKQLLLAASQFMDHENTSVNI